MLLDKDQFDKAENHSMRHVLIMCRLHIITIEEIKTYDVKYWHTMLAVNLESVLGNSVCRKSCCFTNIN